MVPLRADAPLLAQAPILGPWLLAPKLGSAFCPNRFPARQPRAEKRNGELPAPLGFPARRGRPGSGLRPSTPPAG